MKTLLFILSLCTISYACEEHGDFNVIFESDKINCSSLVDFCPPVVHVTAKGPITNTTVFHYAPAFDHKNNEKLKFTLHIPFCDEKTFKMEEVYVKVGYNGDVGFLLLLLCMLPIICCLSNPSKSDDNFLLYLLLAGNSRRGYRSYSNRSNKW